jgi:hypothetical protein
MKIVLCQQCWAWVPTQGEQCPECHHALDLETPDPSPAEMAEKLGEAVCRIAAVQFDRRKLPQTGRLWGTTAGLLFLPELTALADGSLADAQEVASSGTWNWWGLLRRPSPRRTQDWAGEFATAVEPFDVVAAFLDRPGAAFFARQDMVRLWNRGRNWTLQRSIGRTVKWTMLSPPEVWRPAWRQLFQTAAEWRCVASP